MKNFLQPRSQERARIRASPVATSPIILLDEEDRSRAFEPILHGIGTWLALRPSDRAAANGHLQTEGMCTHMAAVDLREATQREATRQEGRVVAQATAVGFLLVYYETRSGQAVWEWRRGTEPRPQFATRRVAVHWMRGWRGHDDTPAVA